MKKSNRHRVELRNEVHLRMAQPNKMFPDWLTERVRFMRYKVAVPCAECGKKRKCHWTLLCEFKANTFPEGPAFSLIKGKILPPLSPVCAAHLLAPVTTPVKQSKK